MCSTLKRTSEAVTEWSKVFHKQPTETYTSSVTFIKQLTVVAVSTITYLKNAVPEDNYTTDNFGGLKIKVLKNKCENDLAQFLVSSLTQAFEAIDKKYLHQIALCFYEEPRAPENLVEYHLFQYEYSAGGASVSVRSGGRGGAGAGAGAGAGPGAAGGVGAGVGATFDAIRERTLQLLRTCVVMLPQTQLPKPFDVSLRLYYNDNAPEGYQAPGFVGASGPWPDEVTLGAGGARGARRVKLGSVATPFHRLQLHTYHRDFAPRDSDASETTPTAVLSQQDEFTTSEGMCTEGLEAAPGAPTPPPEAGSVRCECGRADRDPDHMMLICSYCDTWQHAACYGVLGADEGAGAGGRGHCCVPCGERLPAGSPPGAPQPDPGLMRASNRTCYAIFRRALWWLRAAGARAVSCAGAGAVSCAGARAVSCAGAGAALALGASSTRKLLRVLRSHAVLAADPPADPEEPVEVVPEALEAAISRYFRAPPSPAPSPCGGLAARLLQAAHGRPPHDPLERESLQASAPSQLLEPSAESQPLSQPRKQNSTLEQYRSALAPIDMDEAPAAILKSPPARKRKQDGDRKKPGVRTKRARKAPRE